MGTDNRPAWARDAVSTPNVQAPRDVTTSSPTHSHLDADRIAAARARGKAGTKANNLPGAQYGAEYPAWRFEDCEAGPQTSIHDFEHLIFVLGFLRDFDKRFYIDTASAKYNRHTGICTGGEPPFSIFDLRAAVERRCAELGVSLALVEEYLAVPHGYVGEREYHSLTFEQQMVRFKAAQ